MFEKKKLKVKNSRRYKRLRAGYLLKYQMAGSKEEPVVTNLKDLSAGGARFVTDRFLPEAALVRVSFLVPPLDLSVEALARVLRVRQIKQGLAFYVAINFIELSNEAKEAINSFIEHLSQIPDTLQLVSGSEVVERTVLV